MNRTTESTKQAVSLLEEGTRSITALARELGVSHEPLSKWRQRHRAACACATPPPSMSRKGNCYDNAAMQPIWATLKTETLRHSHPRHPRRRHHHDIRLHHHLL